MIEDVCLTFPVQILLKVREKGGEREGEGGRERERGGGRENGMLDTRLCLVLYCT